MFSWNEQSVRWFLDASAYTGYHKALAEKVLPYLDAGDTVLDAGCGLGRLDIELAGHVAEITAVDVNECVTDVLRRDIENRGLSNLHVRCGDVTGLSEVFDVMLMSFFGQVDNIALFERFRRRLIRIVGAGTKSQLYPERHRLNSKITTPLIREELEAQGIKYKLELCTIEFGQPLRSWQDAEAYILKNAPFADNAEINEFLHESIARTDREDFPLYLPYQKELGIFIIDKEDIP